MTKNKILSKINPLILNGIAHRGLHNENYTENGLNAFKNAINNNLAFELDVHLTKDNELVVCHDSSLKRTTGKEGIIEELTLKEIKDNYELLDKSKVPTLKEVLELTNEKVPIIVELKEYHKNSTHLSKKVIEELKVIKDPKNIFLISFFPLSLYKCGHKYMRGLLVGTGNEWTYMFRFFFPSLDLEYSMIEEKRVRRYQKKHFVNVWTIENEEALKLVAHKVDTITFQHMEKEKIKEALN